MDLEIVIVLGLLVVAVGLFATRALPVDLVTIFLLLALVLTGILNPAEAFTGFSSQIIIILGSIFVINGALLEGRVIDLVSAWLLRFAGGSVNKLQLTTMSVVGGLSGFMNNTAVTSLFIGPTMSIARKLEISPSKLLMPVCFASILGGTCTLIGTSTNVAVSGELAVRLHCVLTYAKGGGKTHRAWRIAAGWNSNRKYSLFENKVCRQNYVEGSWRISIYLFSGKLFMCSTF